MNRDLTEGSPGKVLWQFCLPLFGSILFQQLYNIADSFVAGRFIGENALAAVGNSYEVTLVFLAFAFGCNIGCSVVVSRLFGAKEYTEMKTAVSTAMLASGVVCAALMAAGLCLCGPLLVLLNTPAELMADSRLYLDIYIWGLPFVFFYNLSTGVFSAMGDSRTPFLFLAASSLSNIGMDILFVTVFRMGVAGVAWATFLCQGVSCGLALAVLLLRLKRIEAGSKAALFSLPLLKRFAAIAIPSAAQQSFISVGNIVLQGIINGFGPGVMAGYSAAIKLNNLVITSFVTIGNGISNYTAQNLGAGKIGRVKAGFRAGLFLVWSLCLPLTALYLLMGKALLTAFMDGPSALALGTGLRFLRIVAPFYWVVSAKLVADGIIRGAGRMKQFMAATFTDLLLRVALAAVLASTALGATGIWCAWPIGWIAAAAMSVGFYRQGAWAQTPAE